MANTNQKKLFISLEKILDRLSLDRNTIPKDEKQWEKLIDSVNNSFFDFEQERYLLERSMEISSHEFFELNERFEAAELIGNIGHWFYNPEKDRATWSKQTYRIFNIDPKLSIPSRDFFFQLVHEDDKKFLEKLIDKALETGADFEHEFRIYDKKNKKIKWIYLKTHPYLNKNKKSKSKYLLSGIAMDISEKKKASEKINKINEKLIDLSRQAGMSEIAASILHNTGNILNSVKTSISLIKNLTYSNDIENLQKINAMLDENLPKNKDYLLTDEKGKLIPRYLKEFYKKMSSGNKKLNEEIMELDKHITSIENIVQLQTDFIGNSNLKEKVSVSEICDLAIQITSKTPMKEKIYIEKNFEFTGHIRTDRTKLLNILINLLKNAIKALKESKKPEQKKLLLSTRKSSNINTIQIIVSDNGIGIPKENLNKIFTMGFTTEPEGHGLGLHSCAIAAKELGGSLKAESKGVEKGAIFTLTISKDI